jgi:hypothetical protein
MTRLSRLRSLDLPSVVDVPRGDHSVAQDPGQDRKHTPRQSVGTSKKPDHDRITQRRPERKWGRGRGDQKSHARRNIADNTKLKDNFMKELRIEWDRKFPLNDNT